MYNLSFKRTSTRFLGFAPTTVLSILFCNVSSLVLDELSPQNYSIFHYSEYRTLQPTLVKKLRASTYEYTWSTQDVNLVLWLTIHG
jgi:hypothetical protein